jgi:hypothetical protein
VWWSTSIIPALRKWRQEELKAILGLHSLILSQKKKEKPSKNRTEGVTQVVEHLLCKHEGLSSNSFHTKKKNLFKE